jgi:hypothetical protein
MTEKEEQQAQSQQPETWAGAIKEFFKQLGAVSTLLILVLSMGQCTGCVDIYRLFGL